MSIIRVLKNMSCYMEECMGEIMNLLNLDPKIIVSWNISFTNAGY